MGGNWLIQSFIAVLFLTPAWLAIPFFQKNFGVPGSTFVFWYFLGASATVGMFNIATATPLIPSWQIATVIFVIGLALGGVANLAVFNAVGIAPNPGLPVSIANVSSVTTFLLAIVLAWFLPKYFQAAPFDWRAFAGVVLVVGGAALIAVR